MSIYVFSTTKRTIKLLLLLLLKEKFQDFYKSLIIL